MSETRAEHPSYASEHISDPQYATQSGLYSSNNPQANSLRDHQDNDSTSSQSERYYTHQSSAINSQRPFGPQTNYPQLWQPTSSSTTAEGSSSSNGYSSQLSNSPAAVYGASLAAVNGVVVPSKRGPDQRPLKPSGIQPISSNIPRYSCPVCGTIYAHQNEVRSHFVACVTRNGNPNGAFWDRGQHWGRDENGGEDEGGNSRSTRSSLPQHSNPPTIPTNPPPAPPDKRSARTKKMDAQLDACNGVVIPSTLAAGE